MYLFICLLIFNHLFHVENFYFFNKLLGSSLNCASVLALRSISKYEINIPNLNENISRMKNEASGQEQKHCQESNLMNQELQKLKEYAADIVR